MRTSYEQSILDFVKDTDRRIMENDQRLTNINQRMDSVEVSIRKLEGHMGRMAELLQKPTPGIFPSQPEQAKMISVSNVESSQEVQSNLNSLDIHDDNNVAEIIVENKSKEIPKESPSSLDTRPYYPRVPYPSRLIRNKAESKFSDLYDMLSKVNVNLPLLKVVKSIPSYAKFFKELSTRKRKYAPNEKIVVSEQVSAVLREDLPPKLKDPGSFNIMISVGGSKKVRGMLDLGASINLMPYSLFCELKLGGLKSTTMSLQLADRSVKYPKGIVEDVLVQIDKLIIPVDFVVLDMDRENKNVEDVPILLGRPFHGYC